MAKKYLKIAGPREELPDIDSEMEYIRYADTGNQRRFILRANELDLGYDLPGPEKKLIIPPHAITVVRTGVKLKFPVFRGLRRRIIKYIFGLDVSGIGGLIFPRGRTQILIGSGVVDAGYRGEILVKVFNPTDSNIVLEDHAPFAQLILTPVINVGVKHGEVPDNTKRGQKGGIWNTDSAQLK